MSRNLQTSSVISFVISLRLVLQMCKDSIFTTLVQSMFVDLLNSIFFSLDHPNFKSHPRFSTESRGYMATIFEPLFWQGYPSFFLVTHSSLSTILRVESHFTENGRSEGSYRVAIGSSGWALGLGASECEPFYSPASNHE